MVAHSWRINAVKAAVSRALPHNSRLRPSSQRSPSLLTGGPTATSGKTSAGSSSSTRRSSSEPILRSISPISKPVTSRLKSSPLRERSRSCSASRRSSQIAISVSRLSAIMKARAWAGRQVIEAQGRHLGHAELAAGAQTAMPTNHVEVSIDQDRYIEAEGLDAIGDLPDLLLAVQPRVRRIGFELLDRSVDELERLGASGACPSRVLI